MRNTLLLIFIFISAFFVKVHAQEQIEISGKVYSSGRIVSGATIRVLELNQNYTTDSLGFYKFVLKRGTYTLKISAVGMKTQTKLLKISQVTVLDFSLNDDTKDLDEILIMGKRKENSLASTQMGAERLTLKTIKSIPAIFGEQDIIKAIQLLPGIKSAGEGSAGIYVRGGTTDQNLVLMDNVPVYNSGHLLGFFSSFNPDAIEAVTVYKTGMPASYGGRLSSVIDVQMRQGNLEKFSATGGIGLISSKILFEGPIQKNKSSFLVAARRTYVDALLRLSSDTSFNRNILYFYDVNANLNFQLNKRNKLHVMGYLGSDKLGMAKTFGLTWGNKIWSIQWQHLFNAQLNSNTILSFNNYQNSVDINTQVNNIKILSKLNDWTIKQHFMWQANDKHFFKFGLNSIYHKIMPGRISVVGNSSYNPYVFQERNSLDNSVFVNDDWQLNPNFIITLGLRLNAFSVLGGSTYDILDVNGNIINSKTYSQGTLVKTYFNLEPRLALSYLLNTNSSFKVSYVRNSQNMHLISNTTSDRPTDKWLPSSLMVKPETSDQIALGYYRQINNKKWELSVETYYKTMNKQIDYRDGADILNPDNIETQLLYGIGRAYGLELMWKKNEGKLKGWISYTLAKSEKKINGINNNMWYNARQDRTHEIALVSNLELTEKWSLSATWVYYTGNATTFPEAKYYLNGQMLYYYSSRNGYRMPSYHRLDIGATKQLKKAKNYSHELAFGLYNAYARKNTYAITFRKSEDNPDKTEIVKTTLFKFLPSISYHFKF